MLGDPVFLVIMGGSMLASWFVSWQLQQKFARYSQVPMRMSGREVALQMLADSGIRDVDVTGVPGQLTDHYHPLKKTVNLSESVYGARTLAAAAVAAHECGHAIQHARKYPALAMRSALVPVVTFSSNMAQYVIMAGLVMMAFSQLGSMVLLAGIVLFGLSTLFSLITLPVEFDASRRALVWLDEAGIAGGKEHSMAQDALKWAALTYVVGALASLGHLLYYVMIYMRSRR